MKDRLVWYRLREHPGWVPAAARWFAGKWGIPQETYAESMDEGLRPGCAVPQWYIVVNEEGRIVAGAGVIDNDYHDRRDLSPNLCALFVEEAYRGRGIARRLLDTVRRDLGEAGIPAVYLVTDHTALYERCGWRFVTLVRGEDGTLERLYGAPTLR